MAFDVHPILRLIKRFAEEGPRFRFGVGRCSLSIGFEEVPLVELLAGIGFI